MRYQLEFPFAEGFERPARYSCEGFLDIYRLMLEHTNKDAISNATPAQLEKEFQRFTRMMREPIRRISFRLCGDEGKEEEQENEFNGVTLLPHAAQEYFPENFMPKNWQHKINTIREHRLVATLYALKRDLSQKKIMVKAPKQGFRYMYDKPKEWLSSTDSFSVYKSSKDELATLVALKAAGVNVERPLGYFEHGLEQFVYTEFVEGQNPQEILANKNMRDAFWKEDARLLAGILKANYKHQAFYSKEFDDKIWKDGELYLIDTDETKSIYAWPNDDYFRKHPDKLPGYHLATLVDCLSMYTLAGQITPQESRDYIRHFLDFMGMEDDVRILEKQIDPKRMTEESYVSMMCDTD